MKKLFFTARSEMTTFAEASKLEMIRCKQSCNHVPGAYRAAILLIDDNQVVQYRLVRCKVCKTERS
jgi:hypothetical protein